MYNRKRIRETEYANIYWRHFEKVNERGDVIGEATVSVVTGEMIIRKLRLGLFFTESRSQCDIDDIPTAVAVELN